MTSGIKIGIYLKYCTPMTTQAWSLWYVWKCPTYMSKLTCYHVIRHGIRQGISNGCSYLLRHAVQTQRILCFTACQTPSSNVSLSTCSQTPVSNASPCHNNSCQTSLGGWHGFLFREKNEHFNDFWHKTWDLPQTLCTNDYTSLKPLVRLEMSNVHE